MTEPNKDSQQISEQAKAPHVFGTGGGVTPGAHVASGITVSFAGTAIAELIDFGHSGMKGGTVETTNQNTTPTSGIIFDTFEPDKVVDPGELSLKVQVTGALPAVGTQGDVVVTHPVQGAWTYPGCIMNGFDWTANFKQRMTGTIKFKCSGAPTFSGSGG